MAGGVTATFINDGDGNRVKSTIGGVTSVYIGNYFEWTGSTTSMKKYYYAGNTRVAMRTGSSTPNYLLGDHLGSQTITTSSSGGLSAEIRYYPWGTERYTSGTTPTTFHFTGQRLESSIGLYYYGARWYDPAAGRFVQADSIIPNAGNSQAFDRYAYVLNNPLNYTDPSGYKYCDSFDEYGNCVPEKDVVWPIKTTPPSIELTEKGKKLVDFAKKGGYTPDEVIQMGLTGEISSWYTDEYKMSIYEEAMGVRYQWYVINFCGGVSSQNCRINFWTSYSQTVNTVVNTYWNSPDLAAYYYSSQSRNIPQEKWDAAGIILNATIYPKSEWTIFDTKLPPNSLPINRNIAFDVEIIPVNLITSRLGHDPTMGVNGDFLYFEKVKYQGADALSVIMTARQWKIWNP